MSSSAVKLLSGDMRSLSYVQRVSFDFPGTLFPHAICLGDADNDSLNELIVGDTSGKLHVYKNDDSKPWITRTCVGMLTCVGVGDICNRGRNFVVAVGAEGWFHLFDLSAVAGAKSDSSSQQEALFSDDQKPCFSQHIPANTKVILISDIDGDGRSELVVGYTDRVVRAFPLGGAHRFFRPELWTAGPAEEVASGGTGGQPVSKPRPRGSS